jgi:hypothetical protein
MRFIGVTVSTALTCAFALFGCDVRETDEPGEVSIDGPALTAHTLLGAAVSKGTTPLHAFNRDCQAFAGAGQGQSIDCEEAAIGSNFHFGVHRVYMSWGAQLPTAAFDDDLARNRLTLWDLHVNCNSDGVTWNEIATAGPNSTIHATLASYGSALAAWQHSAASSGSLWKGVQYFTFMHEADWGEHAFGCGTADEWKAAYQKVVAIWTAAGVSMSKLHLGIILIGNHDTQWATFWPPNDAWLGANLTWAGADPYNTYSTALGSTFCGPTKPWKSFAEASSVFYQWVEHPGQYGHPKLQPIIAEVGDEEGPPGVPSKSKAQWLADMGSFAQHQWPDLFAIAYFDEVGGICSNYVDSSEASWKEWKELATTPYFEQ